MVVKRLVITPEQRIVLATIDPKLFVDGIFSSEQFAAIVAIAHSSERIGYGFTIRTANATELHITGRFLPGFRGELVKEIEKLRRKAAMITA